MTNIYLTDSDKEDIVDFLKNNKELYKKTREHFKDQAIKESLWEEFARSCKLSVKVSKPWFDSQRTHYRKLKQSKSGQAPKGDDRTSRLDTGQARIPEVAYQMQGAQQTSSFQITSPRS